MADELARAGVTEREAEVLRAVGERLRNREIAERLHVSIRTVESHIAALLRKLGVADRAGLVEAGERLLRRPVPGRPAAPAPLTSLVGREREAAEVRERLGTHRLVTLVGPGGVGKTRLALHVAGPVVFFADLAPVTADLVGGVVARALGVVPEPGWSLASDVTGLLLVDNCEHVVAEAAAVVAELLGGGSLAVLATSREPLGVPGEVVYPVPPLDVPEDGAAVGDSAAVRLFVERAAAASPGFALTDANAAAVAALCRRVDGLPLAIELAASRIRTFGPAELVEHLEHRFDLLSAGARTTGPRHRTLRGAIDWSYRLLDDDERALFDRLGVFPADFDYAAVRAVHPGAVVSLLPTLVDKSLVTSAGADERRYRLLETIRAYAAERLAGSAAAAAARRDHAAHYVAFAEDAAGHLRGAGQRRWLDRLTAEQPNLRAALAHCVEAGDLPAAWRWIAALERFWDVTGQRREASEWVQRVLAAGEPPASPAVVAGLAAASALLHASDGRTALDLAERARRLAAGLDDVSRARAAHALGVSATWLRPELSRPALTEALAGFGAGYDWDRALVMQGFVSISSALSEALQWGRDAVTLFRRVGDQVFAANTLFMMAQRAMNAGVGDDEVRGWLTESRELADAAGSEADIAHAAVGFAQLAWVRGETGRAAGLMRSLLPTLRRLGDRRCTGRALFMLGEEARAAGRLDAAEDLLRASAEAVAVAGQSIVLVSALESLAAVLVVRDRPREAAVLLGAAHRERESASRHPLAPPDEDLQAGLAAALGADAFAAAFAEGRTARRT
ncbi:LuxR C-terminal-related transcriptional regulator [Dactylosporangium sp. AC04546]|uniref:ATP-binding protein n=1 Tax=Dactylosporangium sp. AC04546 TaxID=2862460 RepID=UPI001EDE9760|nr:LuxR C-terminal-related transcriptional regulator [Dactylosporangium sp. AC04546]WVK81280.1 LuxR C-terminal-related transcriptional regulator [Dactylosporangium sp. AC04546]